MKYYFFSSRLVATLSQITQLYEVPVAISKICLLLKMIMLSQGWCVMLDYAWYMLVIYMVDQRLYLRSWGEGMTTTKNCNESARSFIQSVNNIYNLQKCHNPVGQMALTCNTNIAYSKSFDIYAQTSQDQGKFYQVQDSPILLHEIVK